MISEDVADHQDSVALHRPAGRDRSMLHIDGERLFDENILSGFQRGFGQLVMSYRRRSQCHGCDGRIGKDRS